ncbi:hypothetical protein IAR55_003152 [Kwoniella newhampshirensis]|uniref:Uncharacterized protein n=1 Tax=Kwoniella newhampshirensis TaxID=1651941 RepID=A0AAW0Z0M1_9TREE
MFWSLAIVHLAQSLESLTRYPSLSIIQPKPKRTIGMGRFSSHIGTSFRFRPLPLPLHLDVVRSTDDAGGSSGLMDEEVGVGPQNWDPSAEHVGCGLRVVPVGWGL